MQWTLRSAWALGVVAASFLLPAAQAARTAVPGTVNYLEGQVDINGNALNTKQIGEAQLQPDEALTTAHGKAEILLTPGVFLRIGDNSQIRLVSNELADPKVEVVRGEAMVEVDQKPRAAQLDVLEQGSDTSIEKEGLYKFNADNGTVSVVDGKARISGDGQARELKKGREIALNGTAAPVKFDTKHGDDLYQWSELRSDYMAQANEASARTVYVNNGGGFWGGGWYWNPYFTSWAWLPGDGYFYSPFGYPFYSPGYVVYAPRIYNYPRSVNYPRGGGAPIHQPLPAARTQAFHQSLAFHTGGASAGQAFSRGAFQGGAVAMSRGTARR